MEISLRRIFILRRVSTHVYPGRSTSFPTVPDCASCTLHDLNLQQDETVLERRLNGAEEPTDLPLPLLEHITKKFSEERIIGRGGFGAVYKGVLQNGIIVAVKRIDVNMYTLDGKSFRREFDSLMYTDHENVVRFLGFCSNTHQTSLKDAGTGKNNLVNVNERLLCLEYISNGSLDNHITDELRGLEWRTRYEIITGICKGLCYLHTQKRIIHMDLKPANILLDDHMVPKITDFGLSRPDEDSHTMGQCFGTPGYIAPEYKEDGITSFKCDIYSLGVIMIELVTGCKGVPNINNVLRRWIHRWNKRPTLLQSQQVTSCINIAIRCRHQKPEARPTIGDIISILSESESTDDHTGQELTYPDDDMLGIEPLELQFAFKINTEMSCSVKLTNKTKACLAFNIERPNQQYTIRPDKGIVPPECNEYLVQIIVQPQEKVSQLTQDVDKFFVQSTKVSEDIRVEDINEHIFHEKVGKVVDEVSLIVTYDTGSHKREQDPNVQVEAVSNYKMSKSVAKVKADIEDINKRSPQKDDILSLRRPISMEFCLPNNIVGQEHYRSKVLGCIEKGANIIGICGMGGSGKTTLLKQINNYYTSERPGFDHVVFIEVGKQLNLMAVQKNIASGLGLLLTNDGDATHSSRAIFNFLKEKKFLLLIDDLWDMLDLVNVGIPHGSKSCCFPNSQIVVITTRSLDICGRMHIFEDVIQLKCLNSDHSWQLFKDIVGGRKMEDARIRECAEKIAAKCGGLPLAVKIIGQVMASKVALEEWEYDLMSLEDSVFHQVSSSDNELFPILKTSYESLQSDVIRRCFLVFAGLAATQDRDDDWEPARLVQCWMGHGLLDEDVDIEKTYLRGYSIIGTLKRSFLIESSDIGEKHVKMHHVVQDLALWIVATEQNGRRKEKWLVNQREHTQADAWSAADRIFLCGDDIKIIPSFCSCPDLSTLILVNNEHITELPAGFFSSMKSLIYLALSGTRIQEIPSEIGALISLQSLDLSRTPIDSLPVELGLLENLRYLYLQWTSSLRNIPNGLLSKMKMLRLLSLYRCCNLKIDCSAGYIEELKSLTRLRDVSFTVQDTDSLWKICNLHPAFVSRLCITALEGLQSLEISPLHLTSSKARNMRALSLESITLLEELVIGQTNMDPGWCLPKLDTLLLESLLALKRVEFKGTRSNTCLSGLRNIVISHCKNLMSVTWITWLPCLEKVYLGDCDSIFELVANDEEAMLPATSSFPRLRFIALCNLKNMHSICDGRVTFPSLMGMLVYGCPMLMKLPPNIAGAERSLLIYGEQKWWGSLEWEDASSQSSLLPFFREIPADFRGSPQEVMRALRLLAQ